MRQFGNEREFFKIPAGHPEWLLILPCLFASNATGFLLSHHSIFRRSDESRVTCSDEVAEADESGSEGAAAPLTVDIHKKH